MDGLLHYFPILAVVDSDAMKNGIHVYFSILISSGYLPWSRISVSHSDFIPSFFKESAYHLPYWLYQFTFPPTMQDISLFSTPSAAYIVCRHFVEEHSDGCDVIYHCSFDFHFSSNEQC